MSNKIKSDSNAGKGKASGKSVKQNKKNDDIIKDINGGAGKSWFSRHRGASVGIIIALVVVLLVCGLFSAYLIIKNNGKKSLLSADVVQLYDENYVTMINCNIHQSIDVDEIYEAGNIDDDAIIANVSTNKNFDLIYNHKKYTYNSNILNILVLGIDDLDVVSKKEGLYYGGQSDAIMMLSLDTKNHRFWIVQVPRDSVALVDLYDEDGNITQTFEAQITVQHGAGDGLEESNYRATRSISRMFYGLPIHSVTSVNMGGVIAVNDAIGGVTVQSLYTFTTCWNDYGSNETFVEGETYTLLGTSAYNYVHYRDITRMNTSSERLARQKQYLNCFFDQAWSSIASNPTKILDIYNTAMQYVVTDLTTSEMVTLVSEAAGSTYEGIYMLEGTVRANQQAGESEHYDLDQSALKEYLINNYYVETK
jgi:anionic cell wall polymer biosynthesis LytR-Cps2A-Psr (LCP) family protein